VQELSSGADVRHIIREAQCAGHSVGLVPTMGFLHEGHRSLVRAARRENDLLVMSIFVNPTQFGPSEDFEHYPRDGDRDRTLASGWGTEVLFTPTVEEMYPAGPGGQQVWVEPGSLADHLCGSSRPGHFRGVATVVAKLFAMLEPDRAYFGQKDAQQLAIVRRMARDLGFPVDVRAVPTVREEDGLALSSRNVYLSPQQRAQAPILRRALLEAAEGVENGERNPVAIEAMVRSRISTGAPGARIDYVSVVDGETLQPVRGPIGDEVLIALAVYFGRTRLIDNITAHP
jgi:pantoate--beta-alanine ligase